MKLKYYSLLMLLALGGCSSAPVAEFNIHSAHYLNPDADGNAAPVVVSVYQLKERYNFDQANYQDLSTNSGGVLGADLIDRNTIEVRPDSSETVEQSISPGAQYLGIVAQYRNIGVSTWRRTVPITNEPNKKTLINLDLESQVLDAKTVETKREWF